MKYLIITLIAIGIFMMGWASGEMWGEARTISERTATEYMAGHDQGCDRIERTNAGLVCIIGMTEEDDELYIIKPENRYAR